MGGGRNRSICAHVYTEGLILESIRNGVGGKVRAVSRYVPMPLIASNSIA